ncbi:hypothetical protein GCK32_015864 [Trichostrongylus colubriformis]|uniref:BPTI/Kunitz inhibitor domain-containing protein n=1 Tax=Trichostrongylus colubriformis TaxID=6319 RepID=A0AAN8FBQ7_TRICO
MMKLLPVLALVIAFQGTEAGRDTSCSAPADIGSQKCDAKPSIRYYYDPSRFDCFPFKYNGCGGNGNNHLKFSECRQRCAPADAFTCPGGVTREMGNCHQKSDCLPGSTCMMGYMYGKCCDDIATAQAQNLDCGGKMIVKVDGEEDWRQGLDYLGISCNDAFCPHGSECRENGVYAFCCK